jgi:hypothetical protein
VTPDKLFFISGVCCGIAVTLAVWGIWALFHDPADRKAATVVAAPEPEPAPPRLGWDPGQKTSWGAVEALAFDLIIEGLDAKDAAARERRPAREEGGPA